MPLPKFRRVRDLPCLPRYRFGEAGRIRPRVENESKFKLLYSKIFMNNIETNHPNRLNQPEQREEPEIEILKGSEVSEEQKKSPFYSEYHFAMADWEEKRLYLPNSDEAISFSMAAHELGHLIAKNRIHPSRFNYKVTREEEERAWDKGWSYLRPYLSEYFSNNEEMISALESVKNKIEKIMMEIVEMTKPFYEIEEEDAEEQREKFFKTDTGREVKEKIDGLADNVKEIVKSTGEESLLQPVDWEKFLQVVKKALLDIKKENSKSGPE